MKTKRKRLRSTTPVQGFQVITFTNYSTTKAVDISIELISRGFTGRVYNGLNGTQRVHTDAPESTITSLFNLSTNHSTLRSWPNIK